MIKIDNQTVETAIVRVNIEEQVLHIIRIN